MMPEAMRLYRENIALKAQLDALSVHLSRLEKPAVRVPIQTRAAQVFAYFSREGTSRSSDTFCRLRCGQSDVGQRAFAFVVAVAHYHRERFHQGLGGQLIERQAFATNGKRACGKVGCRSRLGGMLNYYHRETA
jgi:hypothetical protein